MQADDLSGLVALWYVIGIHQLWVQISLEPTTGPNDWTFGPVVIYERWNVGWTRISSFNTSRNSYRIHAWYQYFKIVSYNVHNHLRNIHLKRRLKSIKGFAQCSYNIAYLILTVADLVGGKSFRFEVSKYGPIGHCIIYN